MKVPESNPEFYYEIILGSRIPSFTFYGQSKFEIIDRLIFKAALTDSVKRFALEKSNCWLLFYKNKFN